VQQFLCVCLAPLVEGVCDTLETAFVDVLADRGQSESTFGLLDIPVVVAEVLDSLALLAVLPQIRVRETFIQFVVAL